MTQLCRVNSKGGPRAEVVTSRYGAPGLSGRLPHEHARSDSTGSVWHASGLSIGDRISSRAFRR